MPQRFSQQRERIYQTVLESRAHPTAEMVYQQLKPEMPRLSLGTVYRNLQQMARVRRLTELDGPVTRFDAVTRPHTHFRCRACGAVLDLETVPYDERLDRLAAARGCVVTATVAKLLGVSQSSCYELMHEPGFPVLKIGSRMVVPKDQWQHQHHYP